MEPFSKQTDKTRQKAAAFQTALENVVMHLQPTRFVIWSAAIMMVLGAGMEFSVALDLFRVHYLSPSGESTAETYWLATPKALLSLVVNYPLKSMWLELWAAAGGDLPLGQQSKSQQVIAVVARVLRVLVYAAGLVTLFFVLSRFGHGVFDNLAYELGGEMPPPVDGAEPNASTYSGNEKATENVAGLWLAMISSAFAASLAWADLQRFLDRKKIVPKLKKIAATCKIFPEALEDYAGMKTAKDFINSRKYTWNFAYETQTRYLDEFRSGLREARGFLNDSRDPESSFSPRDGETYISGVNVVIGRHEKLRKVDGAERALQQLRVMSRNATQAVPPTDNELLQGDNNEAREAKGQSVSTSKKVLSWADIHNYRKGDSDEKAS